VPARGWSGPHPFLLAVTVVLYVVATVLSTSEGSSAAPARDDLDAVAELARSAPQQGPGLPASAAGPTTVRGAPSALRRQEIGVASFNAYKRLTLDESVADARTLAGKDSVDIIGWQEGYRMGGVRPALKQMGWRTDWVPGGSAELAISWRTDRFAFVEADRSRVAPGVDPSARYPVSDRYIQRVVLRDRATGLRLTVLNTHLPQAIENKTQPGRWRGTYNSARARRQLAALARVLDNSPGRWVVATGDFNLDAAAEGRIRPWGGPSRALAGRAVSSYDQLGTDVAATHPPSGRRIDYVYAGAADLRHARIDFVDHYTLNGLHSDHRPLVTRLAIS
jgi:hypothetical protein